jgi:cytochrome o ubiquinol oxidase operon protein cyoD
MNKLSIRPYVIGFISSLVLTLSAYLLVTQRALSRRMLIASVTTLALAQAITQMVFFLHLGRETKPRWKFITFLFMLMVITILVFGSLWIMYNLNYHKTPQQIYKYLNNQGDGI